jgi:SagB-type dehydrogenase family enzyme
MHDVFAIAPPRDSDGAGAWELYHENSKVTRFHRAPPNETVRAQMVANWDALPYDGYPEIALPEPEALDAPLGATIAARETGRGLQPVRVALPRLASLLHHAYGVTHDLTSQGFPHPFRAVPSGGAMYPLEIFFHTNRVDGLEPGIYHYNPRRVAVRRIHSGDESRKLSQALVQPNLALDASLFFFITAIFERTVFKYGERGYRFALLEAGHVAQNLNLAATAYGLGVVNVGGFYDADINALLKLDGLTQAALYLVGMGARAEAGWTEN